jgi:hypothetical protein
VPSGPARVSSFKIERIATRLTAAALSEPRDVSAFFRSKIRGAGAYNQVGMNLLNAHVANDRAI